jgi:hypothetical protein
MRYAVRAEESRHPHSFNYDSRQQETNLKRPRREHRHRGKHDHPSGEQQKDTRQFDNPYLIHRPSPPP